VLEDRVRYGEGTEITKARRQLKALKDFQKQLSIFKQAKGK